MEKLSFEKFSIKTISPKMSSLIKGGGTETKGGTLKDGNKYTCDWEQGCEKFFYLENGEKRVEHCV